MNKLVVAGLFGVALASHPALAADMGMPLKAPPAPPPVASWTGCYVNGGVGYGFWKQDHSAETSGSSTSFTSPFTQITPKVSTGGDGWLGDIGGGCDYQTPLFNNRVVIGVFGDYDFTDLRGSFQEPWEGWIGNETEHGAWAVGGRVGYLVTPRLLTYFNAGYTQARFDQINLSSDSVPQSVPGACGAGPCFIPAHTYGGWFMGGGTEYALSDIVPLNGLFWRTEYRYADYNSTDLPVLTASGASIVIPGALGNHMQKDVQTISSGLVWRFNYDGAMATNTPTAGEFPIKAMPLKAPPAPVANWTGCYVNAGGGYGFWKQDHSVEVTNPPPTTITPTTSTGGEGWLGTAGGGCDYQTPAFNNRLVIGAFADYDFMDLSGDFQEPYQGWIGNETERDQWAIGGRLGYVVTPNLLSYINAGYTQARFDQINLSTDAIPSVPTACGTGPCYIPATSYDGWFFGGGTEYALDMDWIPIRGLFWRNEYRYAGFSSKNVPLLNSSGAPYTSGSGICDIEFGGLCAGFDEHMHKDVQTITSGLVWRFNWSGGPVASRD